MRQLDHWIFTPACAYTVCYPLSNDPAGGPHREITMVPDVTVLSPFNSFRTALRLLGLVNCRCHVPGLLLR